MQQQSVLAAVSSVVSQINTEVDAVFVEGKKDKIALESVGVSCVILYPRHVTNVTDDMVVAILTDFDTEGKRLHHRLRHRLHGCAVVHGTIRRDIYAALVPSGRYDIESINNLITDEELNFTTIEGF